jgi:hypothetical protein
VQARRFDAAGNALGDQFQVNSYTTAAQQDAAVAIDAAGRFVVAWASGGSNGTDPVSSVQARRFHADGQPDGDEFQLNTYTTGLQMYPDVAVDASGRFVAVWHSSNSAGDASLGVQGQLFEADGSPRGPELQVNSHTTDSQVHPSVEFDDQGRFLVVWYADGPSEGGETNVQARLFGPDGTPAGPERQVNSLTAGFQEDPALAHVAGGGWVAAWTSDDWQAPDPYSIRAQRFALALFADGFAIGDTSRWSSTTP